MNFKQDILPHIVAIVLFLLVTISFFSPIFFENQSLAQHDIQQWKGGAQELIDFRLETGEEGLWTNSMFGGMPGYMINVHWSNGLIKGLQAVISLGLPHPVRVIFLAFLSFYILLLAYKVNPYLAIGGALAFGLSSYMIVGLAAGHNARIGAIALMPLVLAGIHITFKRNLYLGLAVTAAAVAMELRVNHLQITYYLVLMVAAYGINALIDAVRENQVPAFVKKSALLVAMALLALGTFFGQFWATYEYSKYSMRGPSELTAGDGPVSSGLSKDYTFEYSNGITEPLTLFIPNILGGSSGQALGSDSEIANVMRANGVPAQQIAQQTQRVPTYWGPQSYAVPYYAGAIIVFLFVLGLVVLKKRKKLWLVVVVILGIVLSWGDSFTAFNYFMFDYFPGYDKFRSVTFAIVMTILAMNLLGFVGLQKMIDGGWSKNTQRKLLIVLSVAGGFCLLLVVIAGAFSYRGAIDSQLPDWFAAALREDRKSLLRSDAWRALLFIGLVTGVVFAFFKNKLKPILTYLIISGLILIDLWSVNSRYFGENNYGRSPLRNFTTTTPADNAILNDKDLGYRVMNLQGTWSEARTSYHHSSIGGYHGAKMRRFQDIVDHCLEQQKVGAIQILQSGETDLSSFGVLNMLNTKYLVAGQQANAVIPNSSAYGEAWLAWQVIQVNNADEELEATCASGSKTNAIVDASKFELSNRSFSGDGSVVLKSKSPNNLRYDAQLLGESFVVFSEIYYPKGWKAFIDGTEVEIKRANYILRALEVPAGSYEIEFRFEPDAYLIGDKVTMASSVLLLLVMLGGIGMAIKSSLKPQ